MAYQGRFEAKSRNPKSGTPRPMTREDSINAGRTTRQDAAQAARQPAPQARQAAPQARQAAPEARQAAPQTPVRKGPRTSTVIFYTIYFLIIIGFFGGMFFVNNWLDGWIARYNESLPSTRCDAIFQELFEDPDWNRLADLADIQGSKYESRENVVNYIKAQTEGQTLTCVGPTAGLSSKKCYVRAGDKTIGYFTLDDKRAEGASSPDWQLGDVTFFYSLDHGVTVQKVEGQNIFVNGVALDDSYTIQIGSTVAEKYLPAGVHGPRIFTQQITGFLEEPTITASDASGNPVEVIYDENTGVYVAQTTENTCSQEERDRVEAAAQAYTLRMMKQNHKMAQYFDTNSQLYKDIMGMNTWMQKFKSYEFKDSQVTGYYRYSATLYSIHFKMTTAVTRNDGTTRDYNIDHTFVFEKQGGSWKVIMMSNQNLHEQRAPSVRLQFVTEDQQGQEVILHSEFYDADVKSITTPLISAPEGKEFKGWFRQTVDENGVKHMDLVFEPTADGVITLGEGFELEPMTLVALFG